MAVRRLFSNLQTFKGQRFTKAIRIYCQAVDLSIDNDAFDLLMFLHERSGYSQDF